MCLGPRFHGKNKSRPGVWRAAGKYLKVIAINCDKAWGPEPGILEQ